MSRRDTPTPDLPDVVDLRTACRLSGRSERTLRRWLADGTLTDLRPPGSGNAPCQIRTRELRAHLASLPAPPPTATSAGVPCQDTPGGVAGHTGRLVALLEERVGDKEAVIEALTDRLADLVATREDLRAEVRRLRHDLADARDLAEALQGQLTVRQGIRGLLRAALGRGPDPLALLH